MNIKHYLALIHRTESSLAGAFRDVADAHGTEPDVFHLCQYFARRSEEHVRLLQPFVAAGEDAQDEPERLHSDLFQGTRSGSLALLRDLQDLYLLAQEADISWTVIKQAAQGLQDRELLHVVTLSHKDTERQITWIRTRMKQAAPQTLIVAS